LEAKIKAKMLYAGTFGKRYCVAMLRALFNDVVFWKEERDLMDEALPMCPSTFEGLILKDLDTCLEYAFSAFVLLRHPCGIETLEDLFKENQLNYDERETIHLTNFKGSNCVSIWK
jgi:hypothetical protein